MHRRIPLSALCSVLGLSALVLSIAWTMGLANAGQAGEGPALPEIQGQPQVDPLYFARWHINYGEYLIEVGKYLEALEAFQTAIEGTTNAQARAEAHLQRASTLAIFLDAIDAAAREYDRILQDYPQDPLAEMALFRLGMLLFDRARYQEAIARFEAYLRRYPRGRFARSVEVLLARSRQELPRKVSPAPASIPARPVIRVRLVKGAAQLRIGSQGPIRITTVAGHPPQQVQGTVTLRPAASGILIDTAPSGPRELWIDGEQPLTLAEGRRSVGYRGRFQVSLNEGRLYVVNHVGIEEYLYGVVPAESYSGWPLDALKAQAIAARTYALYQVMHRQDWSYDVVDDEGDQAYGGMRVEAGRTRQAVDETQGMILVHGDRPILAMYTSNTGWHSAAAGEVFGQEVPYLLGVADPYSPAQPMGRWTRKHTVEEVQQKLRSIGVNVGPLQDIRPH